MKNKKGFFLAEETIKIITSAVVILGLVALLVAIYFGIASGNRLKLSQAKDSIQFFENRLKSGAEQIELISPTKWCLVQWPGPDNTEVPTQCSNKRWESCFCIQKTRTDTNSPGACVENNQGYVLGEIQDFHIATTIISAPQASLKVRSVCIDSPIILDINLDKTITLHKQ
ncbi:MAG TPA: hypothetical protein PLK34_00420 [Candidatus Pacearchaeota archaeon]|nr:hypothetical protein [Candidatus Pacearchaeota archaeon]